MDGTETRATRTMSTPMNDPGRGQGRKDNLRMEALIKPLTFAAGRRGKWVVLLFWIAVVFAVFPYASKLTSVEKNEASSYLPGSAESTKALNLETQFPSGQTT